MATLLSVQLMLMLHVLYTHQLDKCADIDEVCSRFYDDKMPCCWPYRCQQVDENRGVCVRCIKSKEFCVDDSECCTKRCGEYLCA
ncbi:unnamed protein product [Dicrocoelium dendriticum]|nr:unnamed protein product [Dicrocoelium dendriticum]